MVTDTRDLTDDLYGDASLHDEKGAWQMIFGVNTLSSYRKHGYAGLLLTKAIDDARKEGRQGLVLTCKEKLLHYYAKFGFENEAQYVGTRRSRLVSNAPYFLMKADEALFIRNFNFFLHFFHKIP